MSIVTRSPEFLSVNSSLSAAFIFKIRLAVPKLIILHSCLFFLVSKMYYSIFFFCKAYCENVWWHYRLPDRRCWKPLIWDKDDFWCRGKEETHQGGHIPYSNSARDWTFGSSNTSILVSRGEVKGWCLWGMKISLYQHKIDCFTYEAFYVVFFW